MIENIWKDDCYLLCDTVMCLNCIVLYQCHKCALYLYTFMFYETNKEKIIINYNQVKNI